jgi:hypothetical protein
MTKNTWLQIRVGYGWWLDSAMSHFLPVVNGGVPAYEDGIDGSSRRGATHYLYV